jgi:hypothetical protein
MCNNRSIPNAPQGAVESNDLFMYADELKALREQRDSVNAELKRVNERIGEVERQMSEAMVDAETQNFTRHGSMFYLTTKTHASMIADKKDDLFKTLRQEGYGDLIYETVNANTFSSFVKRQIDEHEQALEDGVREDRGGADNHMPKWLDGLVNVFRETTVGVRKSAKR